MVGNDVSTFHEGDRVYGMSFVSPKGGFYAQFAAVKAATVSHLPHNLSPGAGRGDGGGCGHGPAGPG